MTETDTVPATGTTLYAHWTANAYTVKFNANGGTGTMADQTMTYDVAAMLRANAFTLADSTFMGWTPSAVGDVVWPDCAVVTNLASSQGAIVQLYAVWLAPPTAVSASDASSTEAVTVTWTAASHAKNYEVWRGTGTTPAGATKMAAGVTGTEWADKTAVVGTVYRYWVRSVADGVVSGFAGGDEGRRLVGTPDWFSVEVGDNMTDVHLKWYSYVTGGITYEIWRARYTQVPGGTDTLVGNWTCVASFDSNTRSWDDRPDMTGNAFYQYRVRVLSATDAGGFTKISEVRTYHTPGSYTLHVRQAVDTGLVQQVVVEAGHNV